MEMTKRTRMISLGYALLSGCLLFLASPIVGYWILASVALIPFFVGYFLLQTRRDRAVATLLMGLPYCLAEGEPLFRLAGTWWVGVEHSMFSTSVIYVSGIAAIIIFAASCYILALWLGEVLSRVLPKPIAMGLTFALVELVRSSIFLAGYSWGAMGYLLIDTTYTKHVAVYVGVYGLTFVFVVYSVWLALIVIRWRGEVGVFTERLRNIFFGERYFFETISVSMLLIFTLLFGVFREQHPPELGLNLRVAVIASQISTAESIQEGAYRTYRALFLTALESNPDLILTPENIFPYFILNEADGTLVDQPSVYLKNVDELYEDFLALTQSATNTTFALAVHTNRDKKLYNSIVLYRDGTILSIYNKRKPVPFTEYVPEWLNLPLFQRFAQGAYIQDFRLDDLRLGAYICSEIGMAPLSVHGAKLILSPSNDSALTSETISPLQHQFARMRAIESGAYVIRASKGGVTSIINPYGQALGTLFKETGVLVADID